MPHNATVNGLILFVSSALAIVAGSYLYTKVKPLSKPGVSRRHEGDYSLSFYNRRGAKITERDGVLKLVTDPFTIYANYPNQRSHSYSIDASGFRGGYSGDEGEKLAVVVGGSAVFGQGLVGDNETFASIVSMRNANYHVLNAGVVGFLSGQELAQMIQYLDDLDPSLYIVFDGWNDVFDPYTYVSDWPAIGGPIGFNNNYLIIEARLAAYFEAGSEETNGHRSGLPPVEGPLNQAEYFQRIRDTYLSNISKMNSFAGARGAALLVVFQPELGNKHLISRDEENILGTWNSTYHYLGKGIPVKYRKLLDEAKGFCAGQSIAFIDINDKPEFTGSPQTLFFDVVHPNELGHEIIARIINDRLIKSE